MPPARHSFCPSDLPPNWIVVAAATWLGRVLPYRQETSVAKLYAFEAAAWAAARAVQIHGGYGFIKDYPGERIYRDVKLCEIGEGTSEIQRMIISREALRAARRGAAS